MVLTDAFVDHSAKVLGGGLGVLAIIALVVLPLGYLDLNEHARRDFLDWERQATLRDDMWHLMERTIAFVRSEDRKESPALALRTRSQVIHEAQIVYQIRNDTEEEPQDGASDRRRRRLDDHDEGEAATAEAPRIEEDVTRWGLLEKQSLLFIAQLEERIKEMDSWKKLCLAKTNETVCSERAVMSPIDIVRVGGEVDLKKMSQQEIIDKFDDFYQLVKLPEQDDGLGEWQDIFMPIAYEQQQLHTTHLRTFLRFAGPLDLSGDGGPKFSALDGEEWAA